MAARCTGRRIRCGFPVNSPPRSLRFIQAKIKGGKALEDKIRRAATAQLRRCALCGPFLLFPSVHVLYRSAGSLPPPFRHPEWNISTTFQCNSAQRRSARGREDDRAGRQPDPPPDVRYSVTRGGVDDTIDIDSASSFSSEPRPHSWGQYLHGISGGATRTCCICAACDLRTEGVYSGTSAPIRLCDRAGRSVRARPVSGATTLVRVCSV